MDRSYKIPAIDELSRRIAISHVKLLLEVQDAEVLKLMRKYYRDMPMSM